MQIIELISELTIILSISINYLALAKALSRVSLTRGDSRSKILLK